MVAKVSSDLFQFDQEPEAEQEAKTATTPPTPKARARRRTTAPPRPAAATIAVEIPDGPRRPVGLYFSQEAIDALDMAAATLRRGATDRGAVTKSAIVELALRAALQDLEHNAQASMLAKLLAS